MWDFWGAAGKREQLGVELVMLGFGLWWLANLAIVSTDHNIPLSGYSPTSLQPFSRTHVHTAGVRDVTSINDCTEAKGSPAIKKKKQ